MARGETGEDQGFKLPENGLHLPGLGSLQAVKVVTEIVLE
jgi:hypothetical protein